MGWKYRALPLVTASLFLVTLILTPLTGATGSAIPWNVQTVDIYATGGYVTVDSNNTPHIAYAHRDSNFNSPWKLAYASWNGLGWDIQNITSNYSALGLELDEKNYPHILCVSADLSSGLAYASWTGTNWTIQTIDKNGITGTLALDSAGNPHVAYLANGYGFGNPLNYATSNGSGWSIHTVTVEGRDQANSIDDILGYPHIALGSDGNPRIIYERDFHNYHLQQVTSSRIEYAVWSNISKTWSFPTVLSNISLGTMALDSDGFPHFTFSEPESSGKVILGYASWNGTLWTKQTVTILSSYGYDYSYLTIDRRNNPHISYLNASDSLNNLIYASWTGTVWDNQTVTVGNASEAATIAVDSSGNPHLAFANNPNNPIGRGGSPFYLMYATASMPSPTPTVPEFSWLVILPLLADAFFIALKFRRQKP
ncbi:MAG: hypothetical protein M1167_02070 [Chloroflexi bacterium]|nr:hypothetical protein [Chloroflexota bacterium]